MFQVIWSYSILFDLIWCYLILFYLIWSYRYKLMLIIYVIWSYLMLCDHIWSYLILLDLIWCYLMFIDVVWSDLILFDLTWSYLMLFHISWYYLISFDTIDISWCYLILFDLLWCSFDVFDLIWCYLIFVDLIWSYLMLFDLIWCYLMLFDLIVSYLMLFDLIWCCLMLFVLILSVLITRQRDYTNGRGLASSQAVAECFCDWCLMLLVFCCWFSLFGPQTPKSNVCLFWSDEVLGRIYIYIYRNYIEIVLCCGETALFLWSLWFLDALVAGPNDHLILSKQVHRKLVLFFEPSHPFPLWSWHCWRIQDTATSEECMPVRLCQKHTSHIIIISLRTTDMQIYKHTLCHTHWEYPKDDPRWQKKTWGKWWSTGSTIGYIGC